MQLYLIIYILKRFNHFLIQDKRKKEDKICLVEESLERKILIMVLMLNQPDHWMTQKEI
jgi:hypothetical protein